MSRELSGASGWRTARRLIAGAAIVVAFTACVLVWAAVRVGASALLHPARRAVAVAPPPGCENAAFAGDGVTLRGWRCSSKRVHSVHTVHRGTIIYLHGIADNRTSAAGVVRRFLPAGFDVVAYDSRDQGESDGAACTYGFFEKRDLHRVVDAAVGPVVLIGSSLGGAVALQEAADDPRVAAVVAAETFSDLRTVATERAPHFFTAGIIRSAFAAAEREAAFEVDAVSPEKSAARITAAVLLIHGDADVDTPPDHSTRVFAALRGPKRLILVPGAAHNGSLRPEIWREVEAWIDRVVPAP